MNGAKADLFEFESTSENIDRSEISNMLPQWKTSVLEACYIDQDTFPKLQLKLLTEANNTENIRNWIKELEDRTKTKYSIRSTEKNNGRYVEFKQRLVCHNCTGHKDNVPKKVLRTTKNTNCPSKLTITLHAVKKRYRGNDPHKHELLKVMPCEIVYVVTHNHTIGTVPVSVRNEEFVNASNSLDIQNENNDMQISPQILNSQENIDVYMDTIEKLQNKFKEFLMKSPDKVGPSLLKMYETMEKIKTPSTFASCNLSYGKGSALSRRNKISGKEANVGGHPRKQISGKVIRKRSTGHEYKEIITLVVKN